MRAARVACLSLRLISRGGEVEDVGKGAEGWDEDVGEVAGGGDDDGGDEAE